MKGAEPKVSVIIPTYNRYKFFQQAIRSVRAQTYKNIEIIVVDDASTDPGYKGHRFRKDVKVIKLKRNSKVVKGFACVGRVRNHGLKIATGEYVAFLDDDDCWMPDKLKIQINEMIKTGAQFSCTDRYNGNGMYDPKKSYRPILTTVSKKLYLNKLGLNEYPDYFTKDMITKLNIIPNSSVVVHRDLIKKVGLIDEVPITNFEDRLYWLRCLEHVNCLFVKQPLIYYDLDHGYGRVR